jgi:hypothetical protein
MPAMGATQEVNVRSYGAIGDGIADETAAIQQAIDVFSGLTNHRSGTVFFPVGTYKITATLRYVGNPGKGITLRGEQGSSRGGTGSAIVWSGPPGSKTVMLELVGINGSYIEDLLLDARLNTNVNLWIHSYQSIDPKNGPGTSGVQFRRCFFANVTGAGSANVLVGDYDQVHTWETDGLMWQDCRFSGDGGVGDSCEANWRTLVAGNCKNFQIVNCGMLGAHYGINWAKSSGFLQVIGCEFGEHTVANINPGWANLHVDSCEIENGSPAAFIKSVPPLGPRAPGNLIVENCQWFGILPPDNVVVDFQGSMVLIGNQFNVQSMQIPTIRVGDTRLVSGATLPGFLYSAGNFFTNAVDYISVIDGSNNVIVGPYGYGAHNNNNVFSLGDFGVNPQGGNIQKLKPWAGVPVQMGSLSPLAVTPASSPGITVQSLAELRRVVAKFHVDHAAWTSAFPANLLDVPS